MTIDPKSLKLFVQVMQEGTISAVAEREHIAAAAISRRIAELESTLDVALVKRSNRGLQPTPAGQMLISRSHRVLNELESLQMQLHDYRSGARGYVRIHANMSAINEFLPTELKRWLASNPAVRIDLTQALSSEISQAVADNAADIGLLVVDEPLAEVEYLPYRSDQLVVITPTQHPLAQRTRITFADTLPYMYIGLPQGSQLNLQLTRAAMSSGKNWQIRFLVQNYGAQTLMVEAGLGIGLLPRRIAEAHAKALKLNIIELDEEWAHRQMHICIRSYDSLSISARGLVDQMAGNRPPHALVPP